ncbi:TfoX/Sxy family DNA transformation protein [Vibrio sp. SS-MA-C1-2]|uniref:TfoX/Sxy family DNA transformation protein n=1 Tax=Vibrio sp. SS-MA-C1-2 TaxID=2908646 RepID=UPI001F1BB8B1|nr:TfoX/Sxy family DNA transformation protein [Vibrio sp. SS-MA-C1-2]UJF20003.1 TfoX/Sxy family DNA transformation protein [Vibrio sp. SS-MA-C1-2]
MININKITKERVSRYCHQFGPVQTRTMFGDTGFFIHGAIYFWHHKDRLYLRGGGGLDQLLLEHDCEAFDFKKKSTITRVRYYDISRYFNDTALSCQIRVNSWVLTAIIISRVDKCVEERNEGSRLRDLPNLQLSLERMLIRAKITDCQSFKSLGPLESYLRVKKIYGRGANRELLWKFAGACYNYHWQLLPNEIKAELMIELQQKDKLIKTP